MLLGILLLLTACAPSKDEATGRRSAGGKGTLTVATTTDVVNYNPLVGSSRTDTWITNLMYPPCSRSTGSARGRTA